MKGEQVNLSDWSRAPEQREEAAPKPGTEVPGEEKGSVWDALKTQESNAWKHWGGGL